MPGRPLGRLRKGSEFDSAYSEGSVVNGPLFVVRISRNELGRNRWGFAVGKKLVPKASGRNRLRRRLRESARLIHDVSGMDVVIVAKKGLIEAPFADLSKEMARQVAKAARIEAAR